MAQARSTVIPGSFSRVLLVCVCLLAGACASLPDTSSLIRRTPHRDPAPEIFGARGMVAPARRQAIIADLERQAGSTDLLDRHIPLMEFISDVPMVTGNRVAIIADGQASFAAMLDAIAEATDHVNVETYTFADDEDGHRFADLLLRKSADGVQVNVIYDSAGSFGTSPDFFARLEDGGISLVEFNPVIQPNPRKAVKRDHRKILVIDGRTAFTGGVNIGRSYSESIYGEYGEEDAVLPWRDTDIRLEGPVVAEIQRLFLETWRNQVGEDPPAADYFPALREVGDELVRVVGSKPGERNRITYMMYVAAIAFAERSIHLTNGYFVPGKEMIDVLGDAARRGVDVKIILPPGNAEGLVFSAGRSYYRTLLEAGVKLYERPGSILHAKTGVVDGVWSTVGSTNLDLWSFLRNNEVNAIILGREFGDQMERVFRKDLAISRQVELESWKKRPLVQRIKDRLARMLEYWL